MPLAGWACSSAAGFPVVVFGVLPLPDFVAPSKNSPKPSSPYKILAFTMAALVLAHVAAALKHHFVDRDGSLSRMRPGRG